MSLTTVALDHYGVWEKHDSYKCTSTKTDSGYIEKTYTFQFVLIGSDDTSSDFYFTDDEDAKGYFLMWLFADSRFEDEMYNGASMTGLSFSSSAHNIWDAEVTFDNKITSQDEDESGSVTIGLQNIRWSCGTAERRILTSLKSTPVWTLNGMTPMNFQNRIGWNDGAVEGVGVSYPDLSMSINVIYRNVTSLAVLNAMNLVGFINNDTFGYFLPRTLLFVGCDIETSTDGSDIVYNVTYNFKYMPPVTRTMPDGETTVTYSGWQACWGKTMNIGSADGAPVKDVVQVNVESIYPEASFGTILNFVWSDLNANTNS